MEKEIKLLAHNEVAFEELSECLKTNDIVSMNRATGTGKSFIVLKYLYENRNKRILYLSPTYPIIDQLLNEHMPELNISQNDFARLDTNIYSNFSKLDISDIISNYDIVILDEYHRCGAKKWGIKINELISEAKKMNNGIKIIGTTATEIRYLDNNRNMNEILFDDVSVARLSLADAILQGILPVFEYVCSYSSLLYELDDVEQRIDKYIPYEELKKEYKERIYDLRKYITQKVVEERYFGDYVPDSGKFLAFSSTINKIKEDKKTMHRILGRNNYNEYEVSYREGKEKNNKTLSEFRRKPNDETSVLYSVNLLNEGVHVKDIRAIFMFRETISPIIYFQQLGRLLSYSRRKDNYISYNS